MPNFVRPKHCEYVVTANSRKYCKPTNDCWKESDVCEINQNNKCINEPFYLHVLTERMLIDFIIAKIKVFSTFNIDLVGDLPTADENTVASTPPPLHDVTAIIKLKPLVRNDYQNK